MAKFYETEQLTVRLVSVLSVVAIINQWLADFAYRIEVNWLIPSLAGFLTVTIAFLTLSFRSTKAALSDPVEALKVE